MRDNWKATGKEWDDKSKYNSFNSFKGLTWMDSHYKPIAAWWKGEEGAKLPPPIELSLDPGHLCNFSCSHCNAQRYLVINKEEVPEDKKLMTKEHLKNLIDFMADWGVRGVCIGGGGEPLMNRAVWDLPSYIASKGMKPSFATNGSLINEDVAKEMMNCRWVGVSVDSGTKEMFEKVHGVNHFDKVITNLEQLVEMKKETKSKIDIAYKFLITPQNWCDLYTACKLAKEIGVRDFHARPVDLERKDFERAMQLNYDIGEIQNLFHKCHELEEGNNFRVFTVMHKYDPKFRVQHTFKNCMGSPLMIQCCSDGKVYLCADHRIESRFKLCDHFPEPKEIKNVWGSEKHKQLLKSICVDKECGRCTYGEYARQIEELAMGIYEEDPMCCDFP
jgi:MoaA/NifB/PqqE/SkfB family radical SAM enzyme